MCQMIRFEDADIETMGELRACTSHIVKSAIYDALPDEDDVCLCAVDLMGTARASGWVAFEDDCWDLVVEGSIDHA